MVSIRSAWPLRRDRNRSGELHAAQRFVKKLSVCDVVEDNFMDNLAYNIAKSFGVRVEDNISVVFDPE